jgi:AcrR family transcriptional regulator
MFAVGTAPTRRERVRAATVDEIKQIARTLLVREGVAGVSLRAIARDMGMTAAAIYRYFPSLESLMSSVCASLYDECREFMERARDAEPPDPGIRLYALCRAFRQWSVEHPAEFNLMFSSPLPGLDAKGHAADDQAVAEAHEAGGRFAATFADLFSAMWLRSPFPVPPDDQIEPELAGQLLAYLEVIGAPLPVGAVQLFLSCWIRIYGIVALEIYGHLHFALTDVEPMFEAELASCARMLGVDPTNE